MPIESKRRAIKQGDSRDLVNNHAEKLISLKRDNGNGSFNELFMLKKEGRNKEKEINLLVLIPVRNINWEKNEEGLIVLLKPKLKNSFFAKCLLPRLKNPYYKIKLDAIGSFIWEQCDGSVTVEELADSLKDKFRDNVEPLYNRLSLFFQSLEKNRFIRYKGIV